MELTDRTLLLLAKVIHDRTGVVISKDKAYLVQHRLEPLVRSAGLDGFDGLLRELQGSGPNARIHERVVDAITTGETSFFRDAWFFEEIRREVLPRCVQVMRRDSGRRRIRIFSAGSSTGQETWTLAMLVRELIDASSGELDDSRFAIVGGDISTEAVKTAEAGCYGEADASRGLSEARRRRHFLRTKDGWRASASLRSLVHFRHLNLLRLPGDLGQFDLVLCRNVLIYFEIETRRNVCQRLGGLIHADGWLGLGAAESLQGMELSFETIKMGRAVIYRKPGLK